MSVKVRKGVVEGFLNKILFEQDSDELIAVPDAMPIDASEEMATQLSQERPPIEDEDYIPSSPKELGEAAKAWARMVPDDEVEKFYNDLKTIYEKAIATANDPNLPESRIRSTIKSILSEMITDDDEEDLRRFRTGTAPDREYDTGGIDFFGDDDDEDLKAPGVDTSDPGSSLEDLAKKFGYSGPSGVRQDLERIFKRLGYSVENISDKDLAPDLSSGRFGDWRRAQKNWQPYHPDHNDYQLQGNCKRLIMRCLNIGTRHRLLTQTDVDQAFLEAENKKPVVLSFTHHDFRDMRPDIELVRKMLINAKEKFPKVRFKYSEARNAVREALAINHEPAIKLNLNIRENKLFVDSSVPTFGPQPFLAIKANNGEYLYDNFDFQVPFKEWTYTFDQQTIILKNIESIGVGCCDNAGNVSVVIIDYPGTSNEKIRRNNL